MMYHKSVTYAFSGFNEKMYVLRIIPTFTSRNEVFQLFFSFHFIFSLRIRFLIWKQTKGYVSSVLCVFNRCNERFLLIYVNVFFPELI